MDRERESHPSSVCILLFTPKPHKPGKTRVGSEELGGGLLSELEGRATHSHSTAYVGDEGHYTGDAFRTSSDGKVRIYPDDLFHHNYTT